jgi:aquaporin Z
MDSTPLRARLGAEFLGTFGLVFGGCGSAVLAAVFLNDDKLQLGIGFVGVALAFGLTVLTGAYAFGHVSGGHFNPAVTIGLAVAKRFEWRGVAPYIVTQVVAATLAGLVLFVIATGKSGSSAAAVRASGFASNGYGAHSPGGYGLGAALLTEIVLTAAFLYVILGATDDRAPKGFAPIAIGLALTLIHLISIPVTNTSVNPARSLGVAWFAGGAALSQVWLFIVAPIIGAVIAGASYSVITGAGGPALVDEGIANNPDTGTAPPAPS